MKTTEQKFHELYESVEGNCWHEQIGPFPVCAKCGIKMTDDNEFYMSNPSHTDLQAVINLAKQLGYAYRLTYTHANCCAIVWKHGCNKSDEHAADTEVSTLINALWAAEGRE